MNQALKFIGDLDHLITALAHLAITLLITIWAVSRKARSTRDELNSWRAGKSKSRRLRRQKRSKLKH